MSEAEHPGLDHDILNQCKDFLEEHHEEDLQELAKRGGGSLYIEYSTLSAAAPDLANDYLGYRDTINDGFSQAIERNENLEDLGADDVEVRLTDTEGTLFPLPVNALNAKQVGDFVIIEGQLWKVSGKTNRFVEATFRCERCQTRTSVPQPRNSFQEPHECRGCDRQGPWSIMESESTLIDQRTLKIKTPPGERAQGEGEEVIAFVDGDLCDVGGDNGLPDRAGERVVILGQYECDTSHLSPRSAPTVDGHIIVESIVFVERDMEDITVDETYDEFSKLAAGEDGDPVDLIKESIAPGIEPTDDLERVLEASVAWLFNGYRIELEDGDPFRGDLHIAIFGDPGTAKSSIMSNLARIAPKSVYRSGGGMSKVGLTAAAKQEEFAGKTEWTLEPGVLPRANGGHCIIDEVDEILDEKAKAIHDALENEQLVKVDKAGIQADLPSRTAVCIAGNPKQGRFDPYAPLADQLDMDPALISRMDVILPVTDKLDPEQDEKIADKIIGNYDHLSRADVIGDGDDGETESPRPVSVQMMRDWVYYARNNCYPLLSDESKSMLKELYLDVRNLNEGYDSNEGDVIPATARVLPAAIRMSTAFARVELSDVVQPEHVERARDCLKASIGMNFDREELVFDADRTTEAMDMTQKRQYDIIRDIIGEEGVNSKAGVPREVVLKQAEERGVDRTKAGHTISKLKQQNEVYEPEMDECYRLVKE